MDKIKEFSLKLKKDIKDRIINIKDSVIEFKDDKILISEYLEKSLELVDATTNFETISSDQSKPREERINAFQTFIKTQLSELKLRKKINEIDSKDSINFVLDELKENFGIEFKNIKELNPNTIIDLISSGIDKNIKIDSLSTISEGIAGYNSYNFSKATKNDIRKLQNGINSFDNFLPKDKIFYIEKLTSMKYFTNSEIEKQLIFYGEEFHENGIEMGISEETKAWALYVSKMAKDLSGDQIKNIFKEINKENPSTISDKLVEEIGKIDSGKLITGISGLELDLIPEYFNEIGVRLLNSNIDKLTNIVDLIENIDIDKISSGIENGYDSVVDALDIALDGVSDTTLPFGYKAIKASIGAFDKYTPGKIKNVIPGYNSTKEIFSKAKEDIVKILTDKTEGLIGGDETKLKIDKIKSTLENKLGILALNKEDILKGLSKGSAAETIESLQKYGRLASTRNNISLETPYSEILEEFKKIDKVKMEDGSIQSASFDPHGLTVKSSFTSNEIKVDGEISKIKATHLNQYYLGWASSHNTNELLKESRESLGEVKYNGNKEEDLVREASGGQLIRQIIDGSHFLRFPSEVFKLQARMIESMNKGETKFSRKDLKVIEDRLFFKNPEDREFVKSFLDQISPSVSEIRDVLNNKMHIFREMVPNSTDIQKNMIERAFEAKLNDSLASQTWSYDRNTMDIDRTLFISKLLTEIDKPTVNQTKKGFYLDSFIGKNNQDNSFNYANNVFEDYKYKTTMLDESHKDLSIRVNQLNGKNVSKSQKDMIPKLEEALESLKIMKEIAKIEKLMNSSSFLLLDKNTSFNEYAKSQFGSIYKNLENEERTTIKLISKAFNSKMLEFREKFDQKNYENTFAKVSAEGELKISEIKSRTDNYIQNIAENISSDGSFLELPENSLNILLSQDKVPQRLLLNEQVNNDYDLITTKERKDSAVELYSTMNQKKDSAKEIINYFLENENEYKIFAEDKSKFIDMNLNNSSGASVMSRKILLDALSSENFILNSIKPNSSNLSLSQEDKIRSSLVSDTFIISIVKDYFGGLKDGAKIDENMKLIAMIGGQGLKVAQSYVKKLKNIPIEDKEFLSMDKGQCQAFVIKKFAEERNLNKQRVVNIEGLNGLFSSKLISLKSIESRENEDSNNICSRF